MAKDVTAREYFDELAFQHKWDADEQLDILFDYIGNQMDDDCFIDFLDQHVSSSKGPDPDQG